MENPYKVGKHIYLRMPTKADAEGRWHEWFSDPDITKYLLDRYWPNSLESQLQFFDSISQGTNRLVLSIVDLATDQHIGVCNLSGINWVHRYCDIAVIIGEKDFWKAQYAYEAHMLLTSIAFQKLNLSRIKGAFLSGNKGSKAMMKMLKFEFVGTYKDFATIEGENNDMIMVDLRKEDWERRNSKK